MGTTNNINNLLPQSILVIGAGVVGKATGLGLISKGKNVIFLDKKNEVVEELKKLGYKAFLRYKSFNLPDIAMFCVPTPSTFDGSVNLKYLINSLIEYSKFVKTQKKKYFVIVIRSTIPPTTTENIVIPILERYSELKLGSDFGICMQPEFLRATSSLDDFLNPPMILIGQFDTKSGKELELLYDNFQAPVIKVDLSTAELVKYINNCFNALKISFANEMWLFAKKLNIDANIALQLASISGEGFINNKYGIIGGQPFGGACLPKDLVGLVEFAKKIGQELPLLNSVKFVNNNMKKLAKIGLIPPPSCEKPKKENLTKYLHKENNSKPEIEIL